MPPPLAAADSSATTSAWRPPRARRTPSGASRPAPASARPERSTKSRGARPSRASDRGVPSRAGYLRRGLLRPPHPRMGRGSSVQSERGFRGGRAEARRACAEALLCFVVVNIALMGADAYGYILARSEEHTSELQSRPQLVCRL